MSTFSSYIIGQTISVNELNGPGTYIGVMDATDLDGDTVDGRLLFEFKDALFMFEVSLMKPSACITQLSLGMREVEADSFMPNVIPYGLMTLYQVVWFEL